MSTLRLPQRFEYVRELGRGGMGVVCEAVDHERGINVAVKTLPSNDPVAVARFKREFRTLADIHHPNLATPGELFCEDGQWAFSMELIPGEDFLEYTCPGRSSVPDASLRSPAFGFDEDRLRACLVQLGAGLSALHAAGKLHRDIKPSNIRVRSDGKLFLLDFGLAVATDAAQHLTADQSLFGTAGYMAPEQSAAGHVGPSADMYSVGALLFEALTGRLPFDGTPVQIMMARERGAAPRPRDANPNIPFDLDELAARLLEVEPKGRPSAEWMVEFLAKKEAGSQPALLAPVAPLAIGAPSGPTPLFVGRTKELELLDSAFARALAGEAVTVILEAESGGGKTSLAKRFMERVAHDHPSVVIISGRCYENESVPYNAWDGAIESFASYWQQQPSEIAAGLLPTHIAPLVQTFPALRRVDVVSRGATRVNPGIVPREVQRRASAALRELIERTCEQAPVILFLDDLQWADSESLMLLGDVLREPAAPPLFLLATARPLDAYPHVQRQLRELLPASTVRYSVPALSATDAVELATSILSHERPDLVASARSIAEESGGHPLFIAELARHVGHDSPLHDGQLSLEEALWFRVSELATAARSLVTVLALAARPLPEKVALGASEFGAEDAVGVMSALRIGRLMRSSRVHGVVWLETHHDRLRKAVFERTPDAERVRVFERIALALEGSAHADPNMLAEYWKGAQRPERAARHAEHAADKASAALAFDRAARLYGEAVLHAATAEARRTLLRKQSDAFGNAGTLSAAADILVGLCAGAETLEAVDLKRTAAELYIGSGQFERGVVLLRESLKAVGERFPESPLAVLFWLLAARVWLSLRGLRFVARVPSEEVTLCSARTNTLWSAGTSFSLTDNVRGAYFMTRNLIRALEARNSDAVTIALLWEVYFVSSQGRKAAKRTANLMTIAGRLVAADPRPVARAMLTCAEGWRRFMVGEWADARVRLVEGEQMLRDGVVGFRFQLAGFRTILYRNLATMGRFEELRTIVPPILRAAEQQNDLFVLANVRSGTQVWLHLADDRPDKVESDLADVERGLTTSRFLLQHTWVYFARCNLDLYRGDAASAYARVARTWGPLRRSLSLRVQTLRVPANEQRARAAIALFVATGRTRPALEREAKACARKLAKEGVVYASAHAALILALVARAADETAAAKAHLEQAIALYDSVEMDLHAAAARFRLGSLVGGIEGAELTRSALAWANAERVVAPTKLFQLIAPAEQVEPETLVKKA